MCRTATPGRLAQLENELFKVSDGACDLPMVLAVTISSVQGQRQVCYDRGVRGKGGIWVHRSLSIHWRPV